MITIAFWNTFGNNNSSKDVDSLIVKLIKENHVDVMVLCEYNKDLKTLCSKLELDDIPFSSAKYYEEDRIRLLYSKNSIETPTLIRNQDFYSILRFPERKITVVGVHLSSNMYADDETRRCIAMQCMNDIEEYEQECGDTNTIVIGDFNSDPYEGTMLSVIGFHALPFQKKTERTRKVAHQSKLPFYNPMWNLFGDFCEPVGTYYMSTTKAADPMWHLYDQIIVRGVLARNIVKKSMKIIGEIGSIQLCTDYGIPDKDIASDHLPIVMSLEV